jgi:hypothetical protein
MSPQRSDIAVTTRTGRNAAQASRGRSAPVTGDILASRRSARADIHEISVVPAEANTIVARYPEAIARVRELARRLHVDGWYTSDHTHYARVASCRSEGEGEGETPPRTSQ